MWSGTLKSLRCRDRADPRGSATADGGGPRSTGFSCSVVTHLVPSAPRPTSALLTIMRVRTPGAFDFRWSGVGLSDFLHQPELAAMHSPVEDRDSRHFPVLDLDEFVLSNLVPQTPPYVQSNRDARNAIPSAAHRSQPFHQDTGRQMPMKPVPDGQGIPVTDTWTDHMVDDLPLLTLGQVVGHEV